MEDYISKGGYIEAIGRRKTSVARVRISKAGKPGFVVNRKNLEEYFPTVHLVRDIKNALEQAGEEFNVSVVVKGGGIASQAGAVRHGIARAIVAHFPEKRVEVKKLGYLTRDPRMKERKKFGLKKARKSPQWSKR